MSKNLDYAVNCAGFGLFKPLAETTYEEMKTIYEINIHGYTMCMIHELNIMLKGKFGRIVNISSGTGISASKGYATYTAAKHAVVGLTKAAALDYVKENITINSVAPGATETERILNAKIQSPESYKVAKNSNPIGRMGQPWEIARMVVFLCEDDSSFINGAIIPVDSGVVAGKW